MGYCISGEDAAWGQRALLLVGEGSNGKSVFLDTLKALVGKDNYSSLTLGDIQSDTNRYQLDGKLFNLAEETPSKALVDGTMFKNLVTGGEFIVRLLYKQPYVVKNVAKFIFACNELPPTTDVTLGMFRRIMIAPFNATFDGTTDDKHIRKKLIAELPGILNKCIIGYKRLKQQGYFSECKSSESEKNKYKLSMDTVSAWFEDSCRIESHDDKVIVEELFKDYTMYTELKNDKPMNYIHFARRLRNISPSSVFRRERAEGRKLTTITNVRLLVEQGGF